jgi:heme oxygenase
MQTIRAMHPSAISLSRLLRDGTRAHHERMETLPCVARLSAPDLRLAEYRELLARMYGYYRPLEARLYAAPVPGIARELGLEPKSTALATDLAALGVAAAALPTAMPGDLPEAESEAARTGVLYVLEGATLGGTVLARRLRKTLGPRVSPALRFHGFYGEHTGDHWRRFRAALDRAGRFSEAECQAALEAARTTFEGLAGWLQRVAHLGDELHTKQNGGEHFSPGFGGLALVLTRGL